MSLIEHHALLRTTHLGAVSLSLALFAARGLGVLAGQAWPMWAWVRRASVAIDTVLLAAGVALAVALQLQPLGRDAWLGTKLALLLLYIVLGSLALKRARTGGARALAFASALACVAALVAIARARDPLRWLSEAAADMLAALPTFG